MGSVLVQLSIIFATLNGVLHETTAIGSKFEKKLAGPTRPLTNWVEVNWLLVYNQGDSLCWIACRKVERCDLLLETRVFVVQG